MKDSFESISKGLSEIVASANSFNQEIMAKDKRKKHSNDELVINATVSCIGCEMRAVEFHLAQIESLISGLEEFVNEKQ